MDGTLADDREHGDAEADIPAGLGHERKTHRPLVAVPLPRQGLQEHAAEVHGGHLQPAHRLGHRGSPRRADDAQHGRHAHRAQSPSHTHDPIVVPQLQGGVVCKVHQGMCLRTRRDCKQGCASREAQRHCVQEHWYCRERLRGSQAVKCEGGAQTTLADALLAAVLPPESRWEAHLPPAQHGLGALELQGVADEEERGQHRQGPVRASRPQVDEAGQEV
mmetsp:Transcript_49681/g.132949  ORF Transcript_49681/g.132949 Transcript_49681/m.132949 type:complete len:219 (+) Transcript_49681:495-1151(+)